MLLNILDMVERFQLVIFLVIVTLQNFKDLEWNLTDYWIYHMIEAIGICLASECVVDWIKHAFITKFNKIPPDVYPQFSKSLKNEVLNTSRQSVSSQVVYTTHTILLQ
jgi:hypothetical protein